MRVIAGSARRLPLKTIEGMDTRPTTDRIKETLFNILQDQVYDSSFLDLFAGSGGIGIEALSRGAKEVVFVDQSKLCVKCIKENLAFTKLDSKAQVMESDAVSAINRLNKKFSLVFIDAPYKKGLEREVLLVLDRLLDKDSLVVIEEKIDTDLSYIDSETAFRTVRVKEYKTNKHIFLRLKDGE